MIAPQGRILLNFILKKLISMLPIRKEIQHFFDCNEFATGFLLKKRIVWRVDLCPVDGSAKKQIANCQIRFKKEKS